MNTVIKDYTESKLLKEHPIFSACIEEVRQDLYKKWCESNFSDVTNREELHKLMVSLELVVSRLDSKIFLGEQELDNDQP